jgi:uncharacterized protein YabE (DUF348 family)
LASVAFLTGAQGTFLTLDEDASLSASGDHQIVENLSGTAENEVRTEVEVMPEVGVTADPDTATQTGSAAPVTIRTPTDTRTLWTQQTTLGAFLAEAGVFIGQNDQIQADGRRVPVGALAQTALPDTVEIGRFVTVIIQNGPQRKVLRTARQTVGAALEEAGISLDSADGVVPDQQDGLVHNMRITVFRSFPLTIQDNGNTIQVQSRHTSAADVLAEAGIKLVGQDYTLPGNDALLRPNDVISVVRVTEDFLLEDEPIAYQTLWQATPELPIDSQAIVSPGVAGISRRRFRVRYENGVKVSQIVDGEWIAREPVNEVIGYGTRIDLNVVDTPEGPREFWRVVRMRVTSYTAASSGKTPDDPDYGLTASGLQAGYGVVAIDRNIVPFRSYVYVPGYGIGYAGDTGGGIRGRWIDLGYDEDSFVSWSGYVDVYYLTPVPPPQDINYLLPVVLP